MNRSSFLKSLVGLIVAPKIILEVAAASQVSKCLFDTDRIYELVKQLKNKEKPSGYSYNFGETKYYNFTETRRYPLMGTYSIRDGVLTYNP